MLRNNWLQINHYLLHLVGLTFIYKNCLYLQWPEKLRFDTTGYKEEYGIRTTLIIWQIKPFIILACLEVGIRPLSQLIDTPVNGCTNALGNEFTVLTWDETTTGHSRNTWTMGNCCIQVHQYVHSYIQYKTLRRKMTKKFIFLNYSHWPRHTSQLHCEHQYKKQNCIFLYDELYIKYVCCNKIFCHFFLINSNNRAKM